MLQIVEQTKEEKMAMYMKLTKKQIAEMLINCNDIITALTQAKNCVIPAVIKSVCGDCLYYLTCNNECRDKQICDNYNNEP